MKYTSYFAVVQSECYYNPIYGIYPTREDAWEAIITEAETFAYENMTCCERGDVMDSKDNEWTWDDYDYLFNDAIHVFEIQEVKMFE